MSEANRGISMANPLSGLTPALQAICSKGKVLPATGQALIDLLGPDQDETFDRLLTNADDRKKPVEMVLEPPPWKLYRPIEPRPRQTDPTLSKREPFRGSFLSSAEGLARRKKILRRVKYGF